ncbi:hypothetical protein [Actinoplanes rectilineatus]|uniref:hypothetical protein n=1 Tax=Actinoplanes rectilineatus TaxID=113571 RepID=UPI0005F2D0E0|nr:hypothetical protein [Actinoplanes rectilineatus]
MQPETQKLIDDLMSGMPESWDSDYAPAHLVVAYVRELERRVTALGGNLEWYPGTTDARAKFVTAAAKHVTTEGVDEWNDMVDAWNAYLRQIEANA